MAKYRTIRNMLISSRFPVGKRYPNSSIENANLAQLSLPYQGLIEVCQLNYGEVGIKFHPENGDVNGLDVLVQTSIENYGGYKVERVTGLECNGVCPLIVMRDTSPEYMWLWMQRKG